MYALKQAAIIAYNQLVSHTEPHGYYPVLINNGLWAHRNRKRNFCFCVDHFGVKYFTKDDANHLLDSLKRHYAISTDWEGYNKLGLTIDWRYSKGYFDISMPEYVEKMLDRLQHSRPKRHQYTLHHSTIPRYVKRLQMAPDPDDSELLEDKSTKRIQSIVVTML